MVIDQGLADRVLQFVECVGGEANVMEAIEAMREVHPEEVGEFVQVLVKRGKVRTLFAAALIGFTLAHAISKETESHA